MSVIVSLTSYPERINTVNKTIKTLLNQSLLPKKVVLVLGEDKFPNKENDLPENLKFLFSDKFQILWTPKDLCSYTKLIPALKKYPNEIIVTADDDILYPFNWLELLVNSYRKNPDCIHCHRAFRILVSDRILEYSKWARGIISEIGAYGISGNAVLKPDFQNYFTGVSGVLYPPNSLHKDVFNEQLWKEIAKTEDDAWFWANAVHNGTKIKVVNDNIGLCNQDMESNQSSALYKINSLNNTSQNILNNVFKYFKDVEQRIINDNNDIIISLTSYPERIGTLHFVIKSLLEQTIKPYKIVLYLAIEQFPNKDKDLPLDLLELKNETFEIHYCEDLKSYKKLIPALKEYPDKIIITVDDDLIYPKKIVEELYISYLETPKYIHCHRITRLNEHSGFFKNIPRKLYENGDYYSEAIRLPSVFNKLSSGAGTLFPPNSLHSDVLNNRQLWEKLAPTSDDIWFYIQALRKNFKIKVVANNYWKLNIVPDTQNKALSLINDADNCKVFLQHLNNTINYYPELLNLFSKEKEQNQILINNLRNINARSNVKAKYKGLEQVFSVKNEINNGVKRKVITFFGIKIKMKKRIV